jgi:hypothetical protein
MIVFGPGEARVRADLRPDGPPQFLLYRRFRFLGETLLLLIVEKEDGLVLVRIGPGSRIVALPKDLEKLLVADFRGIEDNLKGFAVVA